MHPSPRNKMKSKRPLHGARSAIARNSTGSKVHGSAVAACPKTKRIYRIHPAIGVARVGGSEQFFIGPELSSYKHPSEFFAIDRGTSEVRPHSTGSTAYFKEAPSKLRRQAARFRIFEFTVAEGSSPTLIGAPREIPRSEIESLTWTVELANKKGTFFKFNGPKWDLGQRSGPILGPVKVELSAKDKPNQVRSFALAEVVNAAGRNITTLGDAFLDDQARLVVLGGFGNAGGPAPLASDYANNDGWSDDVSDGPVTATLRLKGCSTDEDVLGAWLIVGPPDYAPELVNVVSLYDTLLDVAVQHNFSPSDVIEALVFEKHGVTHRASGLFQPHFEYDLLRLFKGTVDSATVFLPAASHKMHPKLHALAQNTHLDDSDQVWRDAVFKTIRKPGDFKIKDPPPPPARNYEGTMPMLWGDSNPQYRDVRYAITPTLYKALEQWKDGKFVDTPSDTFDAILGDSTLSPWGLDRAALEHCVGGPFFPGIEVSWLVRGDDTAATTKTIYVEPFRVRLRKKGETKNPEVSIHGETLEIGPGFFSQQMAQPWHADFRVCSRDQAFDPAEPTHWRIGWWPAQRPDDVVTSQGSVRPDALLTKVINTPTKTFAAAEIASVYQDKRRVRVMVECLDPSTPPPGKATVELKGRVRPNLPREEMIEVLHQVPVNASFYFVSLTEVKVTLPTGWKSAHIHLGYESDTMLDWARGVPDMQAMVLEWERLGFVVGGRETERDATLVWP